MSLSLRKKLSQPQASEDSTVHDPEANIAPDQLDVTEGLSHDAIAAFDFGDMSNTTQPPAPTIKRVSSPSNLHRYKARAAAGIPPTVSPARAQVAHRTAFTENFDKTSSEQVTAAGSVETTPWEEVNDPAMVSGNEHELSTSSTESQAKRRRSVDVFGRARSRSSGNSTIRRVTRSKSRREERQDSATGAASAGTDDREASNASDSEDELVQPPPGLNFNHAKRLPRIPSRQQDEGGVKLSISSGTSAPTNSPSFSLPFRFGNDHRKNSVPQPSASTNTTSNDKNGASTNPNTDKDDSLYPDPLTIASPNAKVTKPAPLDLNGYTIPPPAQKNEPENEPFALATVPVCPPLYDPTRLASQQWIDFRATSSRPDTPWGWLKTWSCCRCSAQTMVEQKSCARLSCGHGRCGGRCKIIVK